MAAPTDLRVEATSLATVQLNWSYGDAASIAVFRSTDGSSYSEVTVDRVDASTTTYQDANLTSGTKYWYKLSDDAGSTFSDVVTVWTHTCAGPSPLYSIDIPGFKSDEDITAERLNEVNERIENALNGTKLDPDQCAACPEDGAVVVDCSTGCNNWVIVADEDINSVSINWCDQFDGTIAIVVPPGTTVGICGFPAGFGFSGDECMQAPVSGGPNGRTIGITYGGSGGGASVSAGTVASKPSTNKGVEKSSGGYAPTNGELTIQADGPTYSLNCASTKRLGLSVCGGRGPYTWSRTGSILLKGSGSITPGATATGVRITVTPPPNTGFAESGEAYEAIGVKNDSSSPCANTAWSKKHFGCDDTTEVASENAGSCGGDFTCNSVSTPCSSVAPACADPGSSNCSTSQSCSGASGSTGPAAVALASGKALICDVRTTTMINNGCAPCRLQNGSTVTVTDSLGKQTSIIVRA